MNTQENQNNPNPVLNLLEEELGGGKLFLEAEEQEKREAEKLAVENNEQKTKPPEHSLILGRFKTQEELEKSYREIEKSYTKARQEISDLKKKPEVAQTTETSNLETTPDDFYTKFVENPETIIKQTVEKAIRPMIEPLYQERELKRSHDLIESFKKNNPDFESLREKIADVIEKDLPSNNNLPPEKLLEVAYNMAKARSITEITQKAKEGAETEALQKGKAFVETGGYTAVKGNTQQKSAEQSIKESIVQADSVNPLFE